MIRHRLDEQTRQALLARGLMKLPAPQGATVPTRVDLSTLSPTQRAAHNKAKAKEYRLSHWDEIRAYKKNYDATHKRKRHE